MTRSDPRCRPLVVAKRDRLAARERCRQPPSSSAPSKKSWARIVELDGIGNCDGGRRRVLRANLDSAAAYERELIRVPHSRAMPLSARRASEAGSIPYGPLRWSEAMRVHTAVNRPRGAFHPRVTAACSNPFTTILTPIEGARRARPSRRGNWSPVGIRTGRANPKYGRGEGAPAGSRGRLPAPIPAPRRPGLGGTF